MIFFAVGASFTRSFAVPSYPADPIVLFFFFPLHVVSFLYRATGSFDPMSSLWPRTAADFAFSQDCGEGPAAFLSRERGFSDAEAGLAVDNSPRAKPIDEVRA